jgi:hypothetical protein
LIQKIDKSPVAKNIRPVVDYLTKDPEGRYKRYDVLVQLGVGTEYFTCYLCGGVKKKEDFYTSTDPN